MIVSAPSSSEVEKLKIMSGTTEITPIYTYVGSSGSEKLFIIYLSGNADPATEYTVQGLKAAGGNTYYIGSSVLIGAAVNGENVITAGEWLSAQTDPVKSIFETASAEFAGRYVIRYWR
ncbi:hypothetical protein SDC9_158566 [bioreactor metagenome]|uniref:Uncharacterized protein n=1 Tax=bioreactor metagenome TaxID=1076179 RepID=A0A645FA59_9ZZZZ